MAGIDEDRARILLRRTAFLSSTLATLGACTQPQPAEAPGSSSVVAVTEAQPEEAEPTPTGERPAPETEPEMPSLEMPNGIGAPARERFQRLFGIATGQNRLLDDLGQLVPDGCRVLDPACEQRWRQFAAKYNELRMARTFMHSCSGSSADAKLYAEREKQHFDHLAARLKRLFERVEHTLERDGKAGDERWERMQEEAYAASPYPCLSIACEDW